MKSNNNTDTLKPYDLLGVGIGVFNMSLAALLVPVKNISCQFFDQSSSFKWHNNMLLPGSYLQTPYLDDLVTSIDPTSPYSFLSFLVKKRRFHAFTNLGIDFIYRAEFAEYLEWASKIIPSLNFDEKVENIDFIADNFILHTSKRQIKSKNIVVGVGTVPNIPKWAEEKIGPNVYHNMSFLSQSHQWSGKRIAIIGGGQSGAEIFQYILSSDDKNLPKEVTWISSRPLFLPLDTSPFSAELFNSSYVEYFYHWPSELRKKKLDEQLLASDGISIDLVNDIYRLIYRLKLIHKIPTKIKLLPDHMVTSLEKNSDQGLKLTMHNMINNIERLFDKDIVILCTGNKSNISEALSNILHRLAVKDSQYILNRNYSVVWDGPKENNIYLQNAARNSHGIMDPNIPLVPWRNAIIINNIAGKNIYDTSHESGVIVDWHEVYGRVRD